MKFIFQLARRELRASWRRLLFFFACIAIGVGAIVAGRSMLQNASIAIASEARNLLTADVQVDSNRPWPPETLAAIDRISQPLAEARTETIESPTMLRPADASHEGASWNCSTELRAPTASGAMRLGCPWINGSIRRPRNGSFAAPENSRSIDGRRQKF